MGLPETVAREPIHTRAIELKGYKREDGLFDIEGHLVDTKPYDFKLAAGIRPAGEPVHGMWLRITVNRELVIVDAAAAVESMPYVGACNQIEPHYRKLVGIAIRPGYHQKLKELFGNVRGCTHLTELAGALATAAFQSMAGQGLQPRDRKPFQLGKCHALDESGATVGRYYPQWYRGAEAVAPADEGDHH